MNLKPQYCRAVMGLIQDVPAKDIENRQKAGVNQLAIDKDNSYVLIVCSTSCAAAEHQDALADRFGLSRDEWRTKNNLFAKQYGGHAVALCQLKTATKEQREKSRWCDFPEKSQDHFSIHCAYALSQSFKWKGAQGITVVRGQKRAKLIQHLKEQNITFPIFSRGSWSWIQNYGVKPIRPYSNIDAAQTVAVNDAQVHVVHLKEKSICLPKGLDCIEVLQLLCHEYDEIYQWLVRRGLYAVGLKDSTNAGKVLSRLVQDRPETAQKLKDVIRLRKCSYYMLTIINCYLMS